MKKLWISALLLAALALIPRAQAQGPLWAGAGPVIEAGLGYTYTNVDIPAYKSLPMNGVDASINGDFSRHFGVKLDLGYSRAFDAFGSGRSADMVTYMGGPVFYPIRTRRWLVYGELLAGGSRETGVNYTSDGRQITGFANEFAWAGGAGIQYRMTQSLSLRVGGDYLRTQFFNSEVGLEKQGNLRSGVSIVYTFGEGREK
jgi:opacity protein-like surface antigen